MPATAAVAVLSVGQNGQVTIPAEFRRELSVGPGGRLIAVRMGDTLVMAPHDGVLESICLRLEQAVKGAGLQIEDVKKEALEQRAAIVQKRYGSAAAKKAKRAR